MNDSFSKIRNFGSPPKSKQEFAWLFIFFIKDILTYEIEVDMFLEQIRSLRINQSIAIYIIRENIKIDVVSSKRNRIRYKVTLSQYKVSKKSGGKFHVIKSQDIPSDQKDSWRLILIDLLENYDATHKIIFTHSHGNAFGVFGDSELGNKNNSSFYGIDNLKKGFQIVHNSLFVIRDLPDGKEKLGFLSLDGVSEGDNGEVLISWEKLPDICKNLNILWVKDISSAIKDGLKKYDKKKVDAIIMNNCYMQMFDTGYILNEVAQYLVAPQTLMDAADYDLSGLLENIGSGNIRDIETAMDFIIADFINDKDPSVQRKSLAISANFLGDFDKILSEINIIVTLLLKNLSPELRHKINELFKYISRLEIEDSKYILSLIDLRYWLTLVDSDLKIQELSKHYETYNALLEQSVLRNKIDKRIFLGLDIIDFDSDDSIIEKKYPSGISICFPASKKIFSGSELLLCHFWGKLIQDSFPEKTLWDDFLLEYYK